MHSIEKMMVKNKIGLAFVLLFVLLFKFSASASAQISVPADNSESSPSAMDQPSLDQVSVALSEEVAPIIPSEIFAARGEFKNLDLAPDGAKLAYTKGSAANEAVHVINPATKETLQVIEFEEREIFDWLRWIGPNRLIIARHKEFFKWGHSFPRRKMSVHNVNSGTRFDLSLPNEEWVVRDLVHLDKDGAFVLMALQESIEKYPSVYRFELSEGGAATQLVQPIEGVWNWVADEEGTVRLGAGWVKKELHVHYRASAGDGFSLIGKLKPGDRSSNFWNVARIVGGSDTGYVLEESESGRIGIQLFDFSTGAILETFYEHPKYDLDGYSLDEEGQPEAAFFTADREETIWFDEANREVYDGIKSKLGSNVVSIVDESSDGGSKLVWAGGAANPGGLYFFSEGYPDGQKLADYRSAIDANELSQPKPIDFLARDGLKIRAYLTLPKGREPNGLPLIILPHGGPFGVRDSLVYDDEVQFLANRGYAVIQPNFRGSGGFGQELYLAGNGEIGRKMQDDLDDAMDWAVKQGIADPKRVCVIGSSYGGYAALWAVIRSPNRYRCAASWAGVTDLPKQIEYTEEYLSREDRKEWLLQLKGNTKGPKLKEVSPATYAVHLSRPVLLAHGTGDEIVPFEQFSIFETASNSAPVRVKKLVISGEGHSFSSQANEQRWYDALDLFLIKHNPADQVGNNGRLRKSKADLQN